MALVVTTSTSYPQAFTIGSGLSAQILNYTTVDGDTSGTVTAPGLRTMNHLLIGDGMMLFTAAPTYATNVATLAYTTRAGVKASVVVQDLTYTADAVGVAGNNITIAYTAGATAGSEVVTVVGSAISVQIETGVSTATQVKAAVDAAAPAATLVDVTVTGTGSTAQVTASAVHLASGDNGGGSGTLLAIGLK